MPMFARRVALAFLLSCAAGAAFADNTPQTLPFSQNWANTGLITVNDNWSGVPGIEGYLGQDITTGTGTDPQTLTGVSALGNDLDVIANQTNPNTNTSGGVGEFQITDPVVALQGSGTADAPYLLINVNTIGKAGISVAYNLRDIDGSVDNSVQPVALQYRIGSSGSFTNVPAGFVADASSGPSLATLVTAVSTTLPAAADNQSLVQVRIITANAVGSDEWIGIDDISITGGGGGGGPVLTVADTSAAEGNSGTTTFFFTFSLSQPAGAGGVSIDYATADGTATAGSDYVGVPSATTSIAEGSSSVTVGIAVNGDTTVEPNETFFVNITGATGATIGDAQAIGTINNDDVVITPIHDIQGSGASSPLVGQSVTTTGIVTGRKGNGFFVQAPDASADADPLTSEGIFVFTSAAPPAAAAVGNHVQVGGSVVEFVPSQDPFQPPLTEIGGSPSVLLLSTGNPLPAAVALTAAFPDPAGAHDQLERLEGMRISVASLTAVAPTGGSTNESNATGTSNGVFHAVVTGVARPFREPGIQAPDPAPSCCGTIPPIPRWDANPELIAVDSDAIGAPTRDLSAGAALTDVVGPLDYGFRRYTLLPDPATPGTLVAGAAVQAARLPTPDEFTVASYNLERFFDTVNDPAIGEPVLTAAAFEMRLNKASLAIRNFLNAPDVLGVVEVENLTTLQTLAARINSDAVTAGQPDPNYVAYLEEGNDVGGIDVGLLIKTAEVQTSVPRVGSVQVTQLGKTTTWIDPSDNAAHLLNDRPPLRARAMVNYADGRSFPLTAIVVHQRSLSGAASEAPNGLTTEGNRVRRKRQAQAEFLANEIQAMQPGGAEEHIVVTGDFNAFEFNDGLTDAMGVVTGLPSADAATAVPGDGVDLVTPDLVNLYTQEPVEQRYSFTFGGNAQSLDHAIANEALLLAADDFGLDHARINADFPEVNRNDANSPSRLSDHDPLVAYFMAPPQLFADLVAAAATSTPSVGAGQAMQFSASIRNDGPDAASFPGIGFAFDAALPDLTVTAPTGWSCDAPQIVGATTSVACTAATLAVDASAAFALSATAPVDRIGSSVMMAVAVTSETNDPDSGNNQASASVNVIAVADLAVEWTMDGFHPLDGEPFHARLSNLGPAGAVNPTITLGTNLHSRYVILTPPAGWQCSGTQFAPFEAVCELSGTLAPSTTVSFDLLLSRSALKSAGRLQLQADVLSDTSDPQPGNNSHYVDTSVFGPFP